MPVAALVHDPALADSPVMTEVAHGFAQMALQNQRLETELRSSLRELQASRSRIMSAADEERRRIERDLHDGAQQRLLALTIQLELAADLVKSDPGKGAARLRELVQEANAAMADIRSLGPRALSEPPGRTRSGRGALGGGFGVPASHDAHHAGSGAVRRPRSRAPSTSVVSRRFRTRRSTPRGPVPPRSRSGRRRRSTSRCVDDGAGLPEGYASHGAGLTNMRDRLGAMGGTLAIESHSGRGTRVMGAVPIRPVELATSDRRSVAPGNRRTVRLLRHLSRGDGRARQRRRLRRGAHE